VKSFGIGERCYEKGPETSSKVCDGISRESVCGSMMETRAHVLRANGELPNATYLLGPLAGRSSYLPSRDDVLHRKQFSHPVDGLIIHALTVACYPLSCPESEAPRSSTSIAPRHINNEQIPWDLEASFLTVRNRALASSLNWETAAVANPPPPPPMPVRQLERPVCWEGCLKLSAFLRHKTRSSVGRPRLLL